MYEIEKSDGMQKVTPGSMYYTIKKYRTKAEFLFKYVYTKCTHIEKENNILQDVIIFQGLVCALAWSQSVTEKRVLFRFYWKMR